MSVVEPKCEFEGCDKYADAQIYTVDPKTMHPKTIYYCSDHYSVTTFDL